MKKRTKIILSSLVLGLLFYLINSLTGYNRNYLLAGLALAGIGFMIWSLWGEIRRIEFITVLILPVFFTVGFGLFYFLLPSSTWLRLVMAGLFAAGVYILMLTENIFAVANQRNIQLLRAAQATGFLVTLVTAFFIFDAILSYRLHAWWNALLVMGVSWLVIFQGLWMMVLGERFEPRIFMRSGLMALLMAQGALVISFLPLTVSSASLFLTTQLYVLLGLGQSHAQDRLFPKTIKEFSWIGLLVLITVLLTTRWGKG